MARTQNGESVLSRVVRILDTFTLDDQAMRVSDIAARSGLHVATTSRLVAELVAHGLFARDGDGLVRTGTRLWELALRASPHQSLREAAMPFMEDLHAVLGHHVQLGVLDGDEVLFVERLSAPNAVVSYTRIAGRLPLHASAAGLALLAHAPHAVQDSALSRPMVRFTERTITTAGELRAALADVRRRGVAVCPGHIHADALGAAVPLFRPGRIVVGALGAVVPNDEAGRAIAPVLLAAGRAVTRALTAPAFALHPGKP